ncbi:hypothetical protein [Massilia sp. MS-15]|uniref:hypothetical protein n=1 Tax=Massilia sp. MS-15 TaxID=2878200 RepID=UPI001CD5FF1C|nr:hypothetical protein [Massilia sp. MS-15]MCA1246682.1 hypothetical protein [Massilia sp. MS-15]
MKDKTQPRYWFPAKPPGHGWGWGLPLTWQGWVVFIGFFVLLLAGAVLILPHNVWYFEAWVFGLAALLVLICVWKGEPIGGSRR